MLARHGLGPEHGSWMMMSGLIALCVLVALGLVVLPLFGAHVAAITALAAVLGIFTICYIICVPRALLRRTHATPAGSYVHRGIHRALVTSERDGAHRSIYEEDAVE